VDGPSIVPREIAICPEIHTECINALWEQNVEILVGWYMK